MKTAHTVGPWETERAGWMNGEPVHIIKASDSSLPNVATVYGRAGESPDNANLIAAAPEMLAALKGAQSALRKAMPFIKDPDDTSNIGAQLYCGEWLDEINEVIAKAKGGAE